MDYRHFHHFSSPLFMIFRRTKSYSLTPIRNRTNIEQHKAKQNHNSNIPFTSITHHKSSKTINVPKERELHIPVFTQKEHDLSTNHSPVVFCSRQSETLSIKSSPNVSSFYSFSSHKGSRASWRKSLILLLCFLRCSSTSILKEHFEKNILSQILFFFINNSQKIPKTTPKIIIIIIPYNKKRYLEFYIFIFWKSPNLTKIYLWTIVTWAT